MTTAQVFDVLFFCVALSCEYVFILCHCDDHVIFRHQLMGFNYDLFPWQQENVRVLGPAMAEAVVPFNVSLQHSKVMLVVPNDVMYAALMLVWFCFPL